MNCDLDHYLVIVQMKQVISTVVKREITNSPKWNVEELSKVMIRDKNQVELTRELKKSH